MPRPPETIEPRIAALLDGAPQQIATVADPEERAGLWRALADAEASCGNRAAAKQSLGRAVATALDVPVIDLTPQLWPNLVDSWVRCAEPSVAREAARVGLKICFKIPDPDTRWWAIAAILERSARRHDSKAVADAWNVLRTADPKRARSTDGVLLEIRIALAAGDPATVSRNIGRLPLQFRPSLLASLATLLRASGKPDAAARAVQQANAEVGKIRDPGIRLLETTVILEELVKQGQHRQALQAAKGPLIRNAVLEAMLPGRHRQMALDAGPAPSPAVVYAWASVGSRENARKTHDTVLREHRWFRDDDPVRMLAARSRAAAKAGDADDAEQLHSEILTEIGKAQGIAKGLRRRFAGAEALVTGGWRVA